MIKKFYKYLVRSVKRLKIVIVREYKETKQMAQIYLSSERKNPRKLKEANSQLLDLFKIIMLFPISLLPGSVVIVTVLEMIAKFFKGSIFPKKQKF